jgi:16S rRNA (cytosine1402-N4)-methyltransferase
MEDPTSQPDAKPPRRPRYAGKNPRHWQQKYKEHRGDATVLAQVQAHGKTPAGRHIPILLPEILEALKLRPGHVGVDCTLGWGGHAEGILQRIQPGGLLLGFDQDVVQLPLTEARLREAGYDDTSFQAIRSNFAGVGKSLAALGQTNVDFLLADLGLSSMQIDNPDRGFSFRTDGPLDMRMNSSKGITARQFLAKISSTKLAEVLLANADEPNAERLAESLAGRDFPTTTSLRAAVEPYGDEDTVRRTFQAIRIAVNEEFTALDSLLRQLPAVLKPGGTAAFLTFHSGEDRRVKKAFQAGLADGIFSTMNREVIRASAEEVRQNSRASSAKLRWAVRAV